MKPVTLISGAGRGIGRATALCLAEQGHDLCLLYRRDRQSAEKLAEQIQESGRQTLLLQADVGDAEAVAQAFASAIKQFGRLSGVVNNAGIVGDKARLDEMSSERLQQMLQTNVLGVMYCCQQAVKHMSTRHGGDGGSIVNVSSVASRIGSPGEYVDYAASKGAVDTLSLGLAKEVATEGVRVNVVRPGIIDTDIHASGGQPDRATRLAPLIPMQRPGQAQEVAATIAWLLSDQASYCTGSILDVSGGR